MEKATDNFKEGHKQNEEKWSFEMHDGNAINYNDPKFNAITSLKYNIVNCFPKILFEFFRRWQNLYVLIITMVMVYRSSIYPPWIFDIPLALSLVFYAIKEIYLDFIRWKRDKIINNQTTLKAFFNINQVNQVKWKDLEVGSIIYLKNSDVCPADIIILDSSEVKEKEAYCIVSTEFFNGSTAFKKKRACQLTQLPLKSFQKNKIQEYKNLLNGTLEYSGPTLNPDFFQGFLKIRKDPKVEQVGIDHFIPRGATIVNTEWIFGMVVYTGADTKIFLNSKYKKTKRSFLIEMGHLFFAVTWVAMIACVLITEILYIPTTNDYNDIDVPLILLTPFLPLELYFLMDIIWLGIKFKYEKQHLKNFPHEFFHISEPNVFSDFSHIEYALFDKTGTLTENAPIVSSIFFNGKIYNLENKKKETNTNQIKNKLIITESFEKYLEKEKILLMQNGEKIESSEIAEMYSEHDVSSVVEKNIQNLGFLTGNCKFLEENRKKEKNLSSFDPQNESNQQEILNLSSNKIILEQKSLKKTENHYNEPSILSEISPQKDSSNILLYNPINKEMDDEYIKIDDIYDEATLMDDAKKDQLKFFNLFEVFALCHYSFPRKDYNTGKINYISQDRESEVLLRFCEGCGFRFENSNKFENPDFYILNINGQKQIKYKILGIIDFSLTRKIFSIIYQNPNNKEYILVVKGLESAIRSKLQISDNDNEKFNILLKNFTKKGITPMIYAYKTIELEEAINFEKKITNLKTSLINQSDQLEELADEIETNLQLMSIVGFKEPIKPEAKNLMDFLHSVNVKPWILTGDVKEKALGVALNLQVITPEKEALIIETNNKEDLVPEIRNILSILKAYSSNYENIGEETIKEGKNKKANNNLNYRSEKHFLLINGQSVSIIEKDPYLAPHLAFICFLVKTVIGFNLSPWNKRVLARIIKKKFPRKPMLMAIGDGYNDILMLQTADVGVEVVNKSNEGKFEPITMAGDIKISNLSQLKEVMTQESLCHAEILNDVIYFTGHKSILLGLQIFLFLFYSGFSGTPSQDSIMIFLYYFYFTLPLQIIYGLFFNRFDKKIIKKIPELYIHGLNIRRKRQQKKLIIAVFLESLFSGMLIFYLVTYVVNGSLSQYGLTNDLNLQSLACFYGCLMVQSSRMLLNVLSKMKKIPAIILCVSLIMMFTAFMLIEKSYNLTGEFVADNTLQVVSQFAIIMILMLTLIISLLYEMFMKYFFFQKWFPNPYDQVVRYLENEKNPNLEKISTFLNKVVKKKIKFSSVIKSIFKRPEWIDVLIQQMLSPEDIDAHEMKLNKFSLKILDNRLERKYVFTRKKKAMRFSRGYYFLIMLTFAIYVLFDLIFDTITVVNYVKIGILVVGFSIFALMFLKLYNNLYYKCVILAYVIAIFLKILYDWLIFDHNLALSGALLALISNCSMNLNINVLYVIVMNIIYLISFIIKVIVLVCGNEDSFSQSIGTISDNLNESDLDLIKFNVSVSLILLMIIITDITVYLGYKLDQQKRNEFLTVIQIEMESNKVHDIFSILVPKFVRSNMIHGNMEMAEEYPDVSILFCDIYDFDKIISTENEKVVQILDNIYRYFDSLCLTHGVQKIETVGKTYMAASGIKICEVGIPQSVLKINKTSRLLNMAFDMIKFIENVTYGKNEKIVMKIGIHTGKVIAGVIGYHKPQFSLIGDTVNTTSRVCSTGDKGMITLSNEAMIESRSCDLHFTKKIVQAKGKGDLITYQVKKRGANESMLKSLVNNMINSKNDGKISSAGLSKKSFFGTFAGSGNNNILKQVANVIQEGNSRGSVIPVNRVSMNPDKAGGVIKLQEVNGVEDDLLKKDERKSEIDESYAQEKIDEEEEEEFDDKTFTSKSIVPSKYLLTIPKSQEQLYDEFILKMSRDYNKIDRMRLLVMSIAYLIRTLLLISLKNFYSNIFLVFFFRGIFVLLTIITIYLMRGVKSLDAKTKVIKLTVMGFFIFGIIATLLEINCSLIYEDYSMSFIEIELNYLVHSNIYFFTFMDIIMQSLIMLFLWLLICGIKGILTLEYMILFIAFIIFNLVKIHGKLHNQIKNFNQLRKNEAHRVEQESLVSQLLPLHAFEKLKEVGNNNKVQLTDVFHDVTLLFADIAGFTKYSAGVKPQDVVKMLKNLFTEFDKICVKHKVYKVYTIGDCYVVMGFLQAKDRDPVREAKNVVRMGLSMIDIIRNVRTLINFDDLDMRIGVHTGSIFGGIIGTDIVRYDIYGRDVLIANKMESNGVTGNIMVSETTKKMLEKETSLGYRFEKKKEVECKGLEKPISGYLIHLIEEKRGPEEIAPV